MHHHDRLYCIVVLCCCCVVCCVLCVVCCVLCVVCCVLCVVCYVVCCVVLCVVLCCVVGANCRFSSLFSPLSRSDLGQRLDDDVERKGGGRELVSRNRNSVE